MRSCQVKTLFCYLLPFVGIFLALPVAMGQARPSGHPVRGRHPASVRKPAVARQKPEAAVPAAAVAPPVAVPPLVTVRGVVLGPNHLALPGATVFVAGQPSQMVVTNQDGEFALQLPQAAQLVVAYSGLADCRLPVPAHDSNTLFVTLQTQYLGSRATGATSRAEGQ